MEESILTEDAKKAINSYLLKWMSILGVLNLSAVAAVLVYIFGVLPEQALEKATKSITDNTKQEVQDLRKQLTLATTDALVESGRAKERANKAINDIAMINKQIAPLTKEAAGLKEALGSVEKNKLIQAQRIVDSILESDGSDQYLQKIPSIESRLSSLDKAVKIGRAHV